MQIGLHIKFVRYEAYGEISRPQFLFWDPLHICETNRARMLKFNTLIDIYRH